MKFSSLFFFKCDFETATLIAGRTQGEHREVNIVENGLAAAVGFT